MSGFRAFLARADKTGRVLEDTLLVLILASMILLAGGQIILRNFFDIGFIWSDELLRMLVLWIALAGAVAASRDDRQINIAVLDRFLSKTLGAMVKIILHTFTAVVCGVVTTVSIQFVLSSLEYGDVLLGQVPAWWLQLILPVGFALMTWRYALFACRGVIGLIRPAQI